MGLGTVWCFVGAERGGDLNGSLWPFGMGEKRILEGIFWDRVH